MLITFQIVIKYPKYENKNLNIRNNCHSMFAIYIFELVIYYNNKTILLYTDSKLLRKNQFRLKKIIVKDQDLKLTRTFLF